MAGENRFSRLSREEKRTSQITVQPLSDSRVRGSLTSLKELVSSALGPFGRLKFFQTSTGGHVTVTSTSSKIIHNLSCLTHPILKLILSSVRGHLDTYNDGGLRTALLALSLLESSLDLAVPRALTVSINEHVLEVLMSHVESCGWKMTIDVGNIKTMLTVVGSVIGTKPACHLTESEMRFVSVLLIQAFLQSLPTLNCPSTMTAPVPIQIMTCEGDSVQDSKILQGVLLVAPEIPTFRENKLLVSSKVKVAVYNISMAGDTEEWFDSGMKTEAFVPGQNIDMTSAVLKQMIEVADWLVLNGVQLVACQKCMHPALKQHLRDKGALVIDRLSILHISAVQRLTGSTLLSTFSKDIPESCFGFVGQIEHMVIRERSESSLDELKLVCQASLSALYETIVHPFVVPGAGCLETHLAAHLRYHGQNGRSQVISKLGCTKGQFLSVINNVASCLETLANNLEHDGGGHVVDLANNHHWSLPPEPLKFKPSVHHCMCGLVSRDPGSEWSMMGSYQNSRVDCGGPCQETEEQQQTTLENSIMDVYSIKMNSYKTAFETANAILRVESLVCSDVAY